MAFTQGRQNIGGLEGLVQMSVDGPNGYVKELCNVVNINAIATFNKDAINVVGARWTMYKASGVSGTGTLTIKDVTDDFRKIIRDYVAGGEVPDLTLIIFNDDPSSGVGKNKAALYHVQIDEVVLGQLDAESGSMNQDIPFTFEGYEALETLDK